MFRFRVLSSLAALILTAAACDMGGITEAPIAPDGTPLFVGQTVSVDVTCPTPLEVGYGGQCVAYGRDSAGTVTGDTVTEWWSSNSSVVSVNSTGYVTAVADGTVTIAGTINGIAGLTQVTVSSPSPTEPLAVEISGSPSAQPYDYNCYYWATASGGTGSGYTYQWYVTGGGWGSASGDSWTGGGSSDFTLHVTVTDSGSNQAQDSFSVQVSEDGMPCFH